jgi:hypothetical protein
MMAVEVLVHQQAVLTVAEEKQAQVLVLQAVVAVVMAELVRLHLLQEHLFSTQAVVVAVKVMDLAV